MQDWIKKPFEFDLIPKIVIFYVQAQPTKGRGKKITIPTFAAQSLVRPKTMHQFDRLVGYYRA